MVPIGILLFLAGLALLWFAARQRRRTGLPAGRVIYADTGSWRAVEEPLYEGRLGLTGRPDYLVESDGCIIPVEVKSSRVTSGPYDAHIFQLAAYCLLVESTYGVRPPYGILQYPNRSYAIDYTIELESELLDLLAEMRAQERRKQVARSHQAPARCRRCGYRSICDQALR